VAFAADAGLLITGGLGGLGLLVANRLVRRGARRLFLLSRGAEPAALDPPAGELEAMRRAGAEVTLLPADAGDAGQLADAPRRAPPLARRAPLSGCSMPRAYSTTARSPTSTRTASARVLRPKLLGAWLLHGPRRRFAGSTSWCFLGGLALGNAVRQPRSRQRVPRRAVRTPAALACRRGRSRGARSPASGPGLHHDADGGGRAYRGRGDGAMTAGRPLAASDRAREPPRPLVGVLPLDPERAPQGADAGAASSLTDRRRRGEPGPAPLRGLAAMLPRSAGSSSRVGSGVGGPRSLGLPADARPALDRASSISGFDSLTSLELRERLRDRALAVAASTLLMVRRRSPSYATRLVARLDACTAARAGRRRSARPLRWRWRAVRSGQSDLLDRFSGASDESLVPFIDQALDELMRGEPS